MSCESIGRHPCSLRLVSSVRQMRPTDAPAVWKQQFGFSLFSFPPLREAMFSRLCERQCLFDLCEMRDFSLLSVPWLVDARIPHVVIPHLLRALDHVIAA